MAATAAAPLTGGPLTGDWGGPGIQLRLAADGGRLTLECADGVIVGPVRPDKAGRFKATGRWQRHDGGRQPGDTVATPTADFSGDVRGDVMTLLVKSGAAATERHELRRGERHKLIRCL